MKNRESGIHGLLDNWLSGQNESENLLEFPARELDSFGEASEKG